MTTSETAIPALIGPDDIAEELQTEWLLTDGLGGFAMGTALGVNTRRYHALLIAATKPPVGRIVALHSLIEQLVIDEETIDLSTQQFGDDDDLHPEGWRSLEGLSQDPGGEYVWTYKISDVQVERRLKIERRKAIIRYVVSGLDKPAILRIRPFTPMRDFHSVMTEAAGPCEVLAEDEHWVKIARGDDILALSCEGLWRRETQWWRTFSYREDRARGQEALEDVWSPGVFEFEIKPRSGPWTCELHAEMNSQSTDVTREMPLALHPPQKRLEWAAEQFVVQRAASTGWFTTVIAGYPWFGDWGRDTMIALPGLLLCTKRFAQARSALLMFAHHLRRGLMPNVFNDYGKGAAHNTVDASLWFVHVVREYILASGDDEVDELLDACRSILFAYRNGTDFDIHQDEDGLITAGDAESQLTWMDAKRNGVVFTPRHGKPVEINALWYNAMMSFAELTPDDKERIGWRESAERTGRAIQERFWWDDLQCLHDVLRSTDGKWMPDWKLRPNQIFAVSLPYSPLTNEQRIRVVGAVRDRLLTPYGLRTLDPADPGYCGRYEGGLMQRDAAYHNGTVWPWLIGAYCEAVLRVGNFSDDAKNEVRETISPLLLELDRSCLNQIAEIYDGDEPQRPSGCPAQAWSVAEVLRILRLLIDPAQAQPE